MQYEGKFILKNVLPLAGTTIKSVSLKNSNGTLSTSGNPINTITYTASQTGPPSGDGDWDNAILIYTSTNNVLANFNYNGGTVVKENDSQPYSSNGTYLSEIPPKKDMSRTGYTFIGWNTADDGSGKYYTSSTNFNDLTQVEAGHCVATANAGNIEFTLYAIWEANEYKINYNLPGGSHGSSAPTTAKYDSVVNISNPTKKGYTFTGWSATTSSGLNTTTAKAGIYVLFTTPVAVSISTIFEVSFTFDKSIYSIELTSSNRITTLPNAGLFPCFPNPLSKFILPFGMNNLHLQFKS